MKQSDLQPSLFSLIREDWQTHGRDWTLPGFQTLAIYRFGNWRMKISPKLVRAPLSLLYRFLYIYCRNFYGIELPFSAKIGRRVVFEHQGGIVIHGNSLIGNECIIRQGVTIGNRHLSKPLDAPQIGRNVNIGAGAKILGKIIVGDHSSIGANAVVVDNVMPHSTVVGIPARQTKHQKKAS